MDAAVGAGNKRRRRVSEYTKGNEEKVREERKKDREQREERRRK